jgi:hypothetical protein
MGRHKNISFKWTSRRAQAALRRAQAHLTKETAEAVRVSRPSIERWKCDIVFSTQVDRLYCMIDITDRVERLRSAMRTVRDKVSDERLETKANLLDWLNNAQSETNGIKLNLTALLSSSPSDDQAASLQRSS